MNSVGTLKGLELSILFESEADFFICDHINLVHFFAAHQIVKSVNLY